MKLIVTTRSSLLLSLALLALPSYAATVFYNNDFPDGKIGTASRPDTGSGERETGDDFILKQNSSLTGAAFTGLMPKGANIKSVDVEIYRVFPKDSKDPPSGKVPTRVNSPSDVAFDTRSSGSDLSFIPTPLQDVYTVKNSVVDNISVGAGGEGAVTGQEVRINVLFSKPIDLPADHYFFVPQVELADGNFLWLSADRPIGASGRSEATPISPDLQTWMRNDPGIAPDWLRVGTDIVGGTPAPTFNASFLVFGNPVPEPGTYALFGIGLAVVALLRRSRYAGLQG